MAAEERKPVSEMDIRNRELAPMRSEEWVRFISENAFTSEELCWLYCCGLEYGWRLLDPENLPFVTGAFLDRGMDPNQLTTDDIPDDDPKNNIYRTPLISATRFEDDATAAESLKLLLEHGGDPNLVYQYGDFKENVFEFYIEDEFANGPDLGCRTFYGLLLCWAYGGRQQSGYEPFTMLIDAPISIFKDYSRYWYEYGTHENDSSTLYIVEKSTGRKVAKYH